MLCNGGREDGFYFPLIYQYKGVGSDKVLFACFSRPEQDDIYVCPYVDYASIICLMTEGELTPEGREFIR